MAFQGVTIRGNRTLSKNLKAFQAALVSNQAGNMQLRAAQGLRDDIKAETPVSEAGTRSKAYTTQPGDLRDSIKAFRFKDRPGRNQAAFVIIDRREKTFPVKPLWVIYGTYGNPGNDFWRRGIAIGRPGVRFTLSQGYREVARDAIAGFTHTIE